MGVVVIILRMMMMMTLMTIGMAQAKEIEPPKPKEWPQQFHAVLVMNNTKTTELQIIDLWYDWPNGRNLNLIQHQLGKRVYDVEWNNGTSFYFTPEENNCRTLSFEVGILRPNWLVGATYLGQQHVDGFLCNVWTKVDFIWYYEDVVTQRPVHWVFFTGRDAHVVTFEVGAVLEDSQWDAPSYCFHNKNNKYQHQYDDDIEELSLFRSHPIMASL